uniref:Leucine-rich repeat-containing N-terminal plant-type domain-containing protein n=1 Tax=Brassica campestris TaxID=3711 RepID=M4EGK7_BRACM
MQKPIFLSCFLFFFFVYFIPRQSFSCPQDHREFLLEFKKLLTHNIKNHSTQIALGELKTWRPNSDCCKWKLVRCNTRSPSKEVTDLNLNGLVLFGSVSSTLLRPVLRVSSLMRLDVSSNFIQGEIPGDGFGNLTRLISLDMGRNSFNGTIPPDLFSIKTLQHLDLSMNAIGGTLSGDIKELKNLEELFLDENLIGGEIPPEIGISVNQTNKIFKKIAAAADAGSCGNQTNSTTVLDLSKNKLLRRNPNFFRQSQEPEAFEPLTKRHLWIDPTQLSELDVLDLSNNKLSGRIPGSSQLDRLNDPNIYANNSKICGMQIQVSCSTTRTEQQPKEEDEEEKEAVLLMYAVGYFRDSPPRRSPKNRGFKSVDYLQSRIPC